MLRYILSILFLITVIGIGLTYDFDFSFAFHTPGSGYTIIDGQMYANNGTDHSLDSLFVQPANGTSTFENTTILEHVIGESLNYG